MAGRRAAAHRRHSQERVGRGDGRTGGCPLSRVDRGLAPSARSRLRRGCRSPKRQPGRAAGRDQSMRSLSHERAGEISPGVFIGSRDRRGGCGALRHPADRARRRLFRPRDLPPRARHQGVRDRSAGREPGGAAHGDTGGAARPAGRSVPRHVRRGHFARHHRRSGDTRASGRACRGGAGRSQRRLDRRRPAGDARAAGPRAGCCGHRRRPDGVQ